MAWRIEKLGPNLGAAITGLDAAAPLDPAAFSELRAAWLDHDNLGSLLYFILSSIK